MNTLTNPEHFSFTNRFGGPHFNKSLLKTRIEMMNKVHTTWKAVGKYALFVPIFLIVFSFSQPYITPNPQTKYLIQTENAIEWVITPKITMKDLTKIREVIEAHGGEFYVTNYQLDPLQFYVQQITTEHSTSGNAGSSIIGNPANFLPIECDFYRFDLKTNNIRSSLQRQISTKLKKVALEDKTEAEKVFKKHFLEYELREIQNRYGVLWENIHFLTISTFPKPQPIFFRVLEGKSTSMWKDKLSGAEILKEALKYPGAITRINRHPVAHEDLVKLEAKTIKDAFIFDIYDEKKNYAKKTYVLVHTNP